MSNGLNLCIKNKKSIKYIIRIYLIRSRSSEISPSGNISTKIRIHARGLFRVLSNKRAPPEFFYKMCIRAPGIIFYALNFFFFFSTPITGIQVFSTQIGTFFTTQFIRKYPNYERIFIQFNFYFFNRLEKIVIIIIMDKNRKLIASNVSGYIKIS